MGVNFFWTAFFFFFFFKKSLNCLKKACAKFHSSTMTPCILCRRRTTVRRTLALLCSSVSMAYGWHMSKTKKFGIYSQHWKNNNFSKQMSKCEWKAIQILINIFKPQQNSENENKTKTREHLLKLLLLCSSSRAPENHLIPNSKITNTDTCEHMHILACKHMYVHMYICVWYYAHPTTNT